MGRRSTAAMVMLGDTTAIPFVSVPETNTPTAPTGTPTYQIRDAAGLGTGATLGTGSATALSGVTGGWYISHAITQANGFAAGTVYHIQVFYTISAVEYTDHIDLPVA
jgi:hypothetical protein